MKKYMWRNSLILALLITFLAVSSVSALEASTSELDDAIKSMRNFDMKKFEMLRVTNYAEARKMWDKRTEETKKAWSVIESKGDAGVARIKQELKTINEYNERDDLFKLCAGALLWKIGQLNEAETIGQIWQKTPLNTDYNYVFYTAYNAARTQDERAIPMLAPLLRDDKGGIFIVDHALEVRWPLTVEFVWGAFGNKGIPVLMDILQKSDNEVEVASAIGFLSSVHYIEALPCIRQTALDGQGIARQWAVRGLGRFGHPDDFDSLIKGLKASSSVEDQYTYLWALYEFGDSRAVTYIIPYLNSDKDKVRLEAIATLHSLATIEGFDALASFYQNAKTAQDKQACGGFVNYLKSKNLSVESYLKLPLDQKKQMIDSIIEIKKTKKISKQLTHAEFLAVAEKWKKDHRITDKIQQNDILAVATVEDIPLLNDVKASLYHRLSDECIDETMYISAIVQSLGRSRYGR